MRSTGVVQGTSRSQVNDRETILRAAASEFLQRGYDATRLEHIASAAGISKSSVYHHVNSKQELLELGLDRGLEGLRRCFDGIEQFDPATESGAPDAVFRLLRLVLGDMFHEDRLPFVALLIGIHGNTDVEAAALEERRRFDRLLAERIQVHQSDGTVRTDIAPIVLARLVFGTINSLHTWARPSGNASEDIENAALSFISAAITVPRPE
jgi:AcrR family transcriptional regulator